MLVFFYSTAREEASVFLFKVNLFTASVLALSPKLKHVFFWTASIHPPHKLLPSLILLILSTQTSFFTVKFSIAFFSVLIYINTFWKHLTLRTTLSLLKFFSLNFKNFWIYFLPYCAFDYFCLLHWLLLFQLSPKYSLRSVLCLCLVTLHYTWGAQPLLLQLPSYYYHSENNNLSPFCVV